MAEEAGLQSTQTLFSFFVLAPDLGRISRAAGRGEQMQQLLKSKARLDGMLHLPLPVLELLHTHSAKVLKYNRGIVTLHLLGPVHPLLGLPARDAVKMNEMQLQLTVKLY